MESKLKYKETQKDLCTKFMCVMLKSCPSMTYTVISRSFWHFVAESFPAAVWKTLITSNKPSLQPKQHVFNAPLSF